MKDGLGPKAIERIATAFSRTDKHFPAKEFKQYANNGLENLELKERVNHLITALHVVLPEEFEQRAEQLFAVKHCWDYGHDDDPLRGFAAWPVIDYVAIHGLDHPTLSLPLLKHLTPLFSAEFALRPFLVHHSETTLQQLHQWLGDDDEHIRRLVSEGTRPRLPWGQRLPQFIRDPAPVITLLEQLKDDPSDYVRRSVANNLNDIAKDHPDRVIRLCQQWQKNANDKRRWIIRHAMRTLIKAGHPESFALLGHTTSPQLAPPTLKLAQKELRIGAALSFYVTLRSTASEPQSVVLDYAIHYMKANGQTRPKVFKLKTFNIAPDETITLTRECSFKKITTRRYYPGKHALELLINGASAGRCEFLLIS